jgi:hypothetical protein
MSLTKAKLSSATGNLTVQFNPKELQIDKTVSWTAKNSHKEDPIQEFKEPQASSLSTTFYFDGYETGKPVSGQVNELHKMARMGPGGHPPLVTFAWGKTIFVGVVESVSMKYTMFLPGGEPCRAEVGFKMKSADEATVSAKGDPAPAPKAP